MEYEDIIIEVLREAGDNGLSLSKISRHVHNRVNTLFDKVEYEEVHRMVTQCIRKNSRNSYSTFERTDVRGRYRLNWNSEKLSQQILDF